MGLGVPTSPHTFAFSSDVAAAEYPLMTMFFPFSTSDTGTAGEAGVGGGLAAGGWDEAMRLYHQSLQTPLDPPRNVMSTAIPPLSLGVGGQLDLFSLGVFMKGKNRCHL